MTATLIESKLNSAATGFISEQTTAYKFATTDCVTEGSSHAVSRPCEERGVVLDGDASLPEDIEVIIELVAADSQDAAETPTLLERLKPFVGAAKGLSSDLAKNRDRYIQGTRKS